MAEQKRTLAVIGGGPGGYVAAIRAAQLGADVTLIEKNALGGTCLNVGCIPTKALLHTAEVYTQGKNGAHCGVMTEVHLDFAKAQNHKAALVKQLVNGVGGLLAAAKVRVLAGTATFTGKNTLTIAMKDGIKTLSFDKIIVATGSVPVMPPIPGIESKQCVDSTGALQFAQVPASLVIIGGGVIGIEMATLYSALGSQVTVIEMMDQILPMMDGELTTILRTELAQKGVTVVTGAKVVRIQDTGALAAVSVVMPGGAEKAIPGEKVLVCVGRKADTQALGLDTAGIAHDRGRITVNENMETTVPGVYAIGDCLGQIMLAHVASVQGEVAAENAMGHAASFAGHTNPSCVYTNPEFAGVGLTEEQAKATGIAYTVGKFPLMANGKALIMDGGNGMVKVLLGKHYKELLGVHIIGPRATDIIAEAALALGLEATAEEVIATIHAHPTVAEAMREAVLAAESRAIHIPNKKAASQ